MHHIGIVGVSPEGAGVFYRQLAHQIERLLPPHLHPRVTLHNEPLERYMRALRQQDWLDVGKILQQSAEMLARCGATICVTPDNAVQHAVPLAAAKSPIPWYTMMDLVAHAVESDQRRVVGLLGTKWVTNGASYQTILGLRGIRVMAPEPDEADTLDRIIIEELLHGQIRPESRHAVLGIIRHLAQRECEAVILACSEAPLLINRENAPLPLYDAGDILAEGIVRHAASAACAA
ncbi:MAG: amino acid racemase [Planctomycetota bacterium]|nr:amino acid racemase [Planctomycetota bacterium]